MGPISELTLYSTSLGASRKEKDDSRRLEWLLSVLRLNFVRVDAGEDRFLRTRLKETSGRYDLPQLFCGDNFIGTLDMVQTLHDEGKLIARLRGFGYDGEADFDAHSYVNEALPSSRSSIGQTGSRSPSRQASTLDGAEEVREGEDIRDHDLTESPEPDEAETGHGFNTFSRQPDDYPDLPEFPPGRRVEIVQGPFGPMLVEVEDEEEENGPHAHFHHHHHHFQHHFHQQHWHHHHQQQQGGPEPDLDDEGGQEFPRHHHHQHHHPHAHLHHQHFMPHGHFMWGPPPPMFHFHHHPFQHAPAAEEFEEDPGFPPEPKIRELSEEEIQQLEEQSKAAAVASTIDLSPEADSTVPTTLTEDASDSATPLSAQRDFTVEWANIVTAEAESRAEMRAREEDARYSIQQHQRETVDAIRRSEAAKVEHEQHAMLSRAHELSEEEPSHRAGIVGEEAEARAALTVLYHDDRESALLAQAQREQERERREREFAEAVRRKQEDEERQRAEAEHAERELAERTRAELERERADHERAERERAEHERRHAEQQLAEQLERVRAEQERADQEHAGRQRAEQERLRVEQELAERLQREQQEKERASQEQERERQEKQRHTYIPLSATERMRVLEEQLAVREKERREREERERKEREERMRKLQEQLDAREREKAEQENARRAREAALRREREERLKQLEEPYRSAFHDSPEKRTAVAPPTQRSPPAAHLFTPPAVTRPAAPLFVRQAELVNEARETLRSAQELRHRVERDLAARTDSPLRQPPPPQPPVSQPPLPPLNDQPGSTNLGRYSPPRNYSGDPGAQLPASGRYAAAPLQRISPERASAVLAAERLQGYTSPFGRPIDPSAGFQHSAGAPAQSPLPERLAPFQAAPTASPKDTSATSMAAVAERLALLTAEIRAREARLHALHSQSHGASPWRSESPIRPVAYSRPPATNLSPAPQRSWEPPLEPVARVFPPEQASFTDRFTRPFQEPPRTAVYQEFMMHRTATRPSPPRTAPSSSRPYQFAASSPPVSPLGFQQFGTSGERGPSRLSEAPMRASYGGYGHEQPRANEFRAASPPVRPTQPGLHEERLGYFAGRRRSNPQVSRPPSVALPTLQHHLYADAQY
eukprot:TRINITY_DN5383_c0_g1_i1.p1 TRINITY_DN5383_c0_g1~~TRINITY_DN5383_c0_g1_i1.p1  ORF type:complete len:1116 (+),score=193.80 TRINITY_DN5383_c0_g1_i1:46-3393(+)